MIEFLKHLHSVKIKWKECSAEDKTILIGLIVCYTAMIATTTVIILNT